MAGENNEGGGGQGLNPAELFQSLQILNEDALENGDEGGGDGGNGGNGGGKKDDGGDKGGKKDDDKSGKKDDSSTPDVVVKTLLDKISSLEAQLADKTADKGGKKDDDQSSQTKDEPIKSTRDLTTEHNFLGEFNTEEKLADLLEDPKALNKILNNVFKSAYNAAFEDLAKAVESRTNGLESRVVKNVADRVQTTTSVQATVRQFWSENESLKTHAELVQLHAQSLAQKPENQSKSVKEILDMTADYFYNKLGLGKKGGSSNGGGNNNNRGGGSSSSPSSRRSAGGSSQNGNGGGNEPSQVAKLFSEVGIDLSGKKS